MLAIGVMSFIGLTALRIPYALPLAIMSALMEGLPNIGPTLAAIPAVLVALISVSPFMAGLTTLLYICIQQIEINYVVPQVMKHATGIRPVTVIVLILIGFRFGGVVGALLSIPIYIVAREILSEFSPEIDEITHRA
jgi:predicted PurR-regulated permease PerM